MNRDLVDKLAKQSDGTYTMRNVITTGENGLPIEMMERFARLLVQEICPHEHKEWSK